MAKKIAAPRKTAPKAPARKKAASKKVTAPLRHKPKGSPKEKLAYLNKGEMAALVKKKGSPARKGPRGLPSFADDSASSRGVSRGDTYGTKGSGSTKTSTGSVSKGGSYNSGTSGSKGGGASTQSPGMGRNEGRVGPSSPMGGQGASFKTPANASLYNKGPAVGVEDRRGLQNMPQLPYVDRNKLVNPNRPTPDYDKMNRDYLLSRDEKARRAVRDTYGDEFSTPREIREQSGNIIALNNKYEADQERLRMGIPKIGPRFRDSAFDFSNRWNSSRTPDIKVGGGPRAGSTGIGSSGGGRGGGGGGGFKSGGIVKPKTFKKK